MAIAALMAIFLDSVLSAQIPEEVLILVIHRATSALLDRRLAGNSKRGNHGLDASTSKKMVKAINKVSLTSCAYYLQLFALESHLKTSCLTYSACNSGHVWSKETHFSSIFTFTTITILLGCY